MGAPGSGKTTLMSYFAMMLAEKQPEKLGLHPDTDWLPILIKMRDLARASAEISLRVSGRLRREGRVNRNFGCKAKTRG
ncbi:MAG: hypothetical protein WA919_29465 [Coleofasciculaceae cyanobacterium]